MQKSLKTVKIMQLRVDTIHQLKRLNDLKDLINILYSTFN